jgi:three-Cys-motif partner protein
MPRCEDSCPPASRKSGKCVQPAGDRHVVGCIGEWSTLKHDALSNYIEATTRARDLYTTRPPPGVPPGGAAYIDLFAGSGLARLRSTGNLVPGSPLIALNHTGAPFTKLILCEKDPDNVAALRARTKHDPRVVIIEGDCHKNINKVLAETPPNGLNFAFVDPYSLGQHDWETFAKLARIQRMDLLIHFDTMGLKRNFWSGSDARLTKAVGTDEWQKAVTKAQGVARAGIDTLRKQLVKHGGYTGNEGRSLAAENRNEGVVYHLVFFSKNDLGDKIWNSVAKARGKQMNLL